MPERADRRKYPSLVIRPYGRTRATALVQDYPSTCRLTADPNSSPEEIADSLQREYRAHHPHADQEETERFIQQVLRVIQMSHPEHLEQPSSMRRMQRFIG